MSAYEVIIGMEVHVQLHTRSKMFCGCAVAEDTGDVAPNTHVCPVCTGMPGVLPVINRQAVEYTIMAGLALNCKIAEHTFWERKSYWYPDLPKNYQISQYQFPLAYDGWIEIAPVGAPVKRIGITRAHLEEDTGKLYHVQNASLIDLNRAGVPLLEIVTEPDFRTAEEAYAYLTKLRSIVRYLGVSSGDMEKGAMRCEPNISLRPVGSDTFGTKIEIKNLNSFRAVRQALAYEIKRQTEILTAGGEMQQVTLGWDEANHRTVLQRIKEGSSDYRYFPEPDLPPLEISRAWVEEIRSRLPELPDTKKARFTSELGLSAYDARVLTADRAVAEYFEAVANAGGDPKQACNWITGELFRLMKERNLGIAAAKSQVAPDGLVELMQLVENKTININIAKEVLEKMLDSGQTAQQIVQAHALAQVSDEADLEKIVTQVLCAHPEEVGQYLAGKEAISGWLMGQVMRATRGKANPQLARQLLVAQLEARRAAAGFSEPNGV
jgi:aspartyl-tRNA(Asn)/glutamyl-tRNA(Gln) amidotransferase subunit B